MKVTKLGYPQPILNSGTGLSSGGRVPPGGNDLQVLTSNGSNGRYWGENVARITSNGSNTLLGPYVNFASGSNITFAVSSNTLTIHGQAGGGGSSSLTVADEGVDLSTAATKLDFVGAGVTASGTGATKTITIPGGAGGGLTNPVVVQAASNGNSAGSVTIAAAASGNRLVMFTNSTTGQITSPTCTNVTWTQIKTFTSAGSSFYAIWVGVVAGGSSGTSITMTLPGSFNSVTVLEVTDALTPTAGANTAGNMIGLGVGANQHNFRRLTGTTTGRFVVFGAGVDNTGLTVRARSSVPSVGISDSVANVLLVGVADASGNVSMDSIGGAGAQLMTEIT